VVRQYYLHTRIVSKTRRIYYVQFTDPTTKKRLSAISTGKSTRDEALIVVAGWLKDGIPRQNGKADRKTQSCRPVETLIKVDQTFRLLKQIDISEQDVIKIEKILKDRGLIEVIIKKEAKEAEVFADYLRRFWDYNESPYIADRRSHGVNIGKTYANACLGRVNIYWAPYFQDKKIGEITRQGLKDFSNEVALNHPDLSPSTIQQIMMVGGIALRWAFNNELIQSNPTIGLTGYSAKFKKRGVLSPQEANSLFKMEWEDKRAMLINMVAMTTGLRRGEILALKVENIGEKYLNIENSFSEVDGLKSTKTDVERIVPVIPAIRDAMLNLAKTNTHKSGYVFSSDRRDRPYNSATPTKELKKMLFRLRAGENLSRPR
jgi:integrase